MTYSKIRDLVPGNRGVHFNEDGEYFYYVNETEGKVYRCPVNPVTLIHQGSKSITFPNTTAGATHDINGINGAEIRSRTSSGQQQLQGIGGVGLLELSGFTTLDGITPRYLQDLQGPWLTTVPAPTPAPGSSHFFAARINVGTFTSPEYHYVKMRLFMEGFQVRSEWVTYSTATTPKFVGANYENPRDIVVSPLESEFILSGVAGSEGYVGRVPRIVGGSSPQYSFDVERLGDPEVPLVDPHQILVDGSVVYVVADGGLFRIDIDEGKTQQVVSGISAPRGLLIDVDGAVQRAIITNEAGDVYIVTISDFDPFQPSPQIIEAPPPVSALSLGGPSGYLRWANDEHTAFYAPERSGAKIKKIDLVRNSVTDAYPFTTGPSPWSVFLRGTEEMQILCNAELGKIGMTVSLSAPIALGIGLVPFDYINNSAANPAVPTGMDGRADTSSAPGYYFSEAPNTPFGGSLSVMLNQPRAWQENVRFYKIFLTNDATGKTTAITSDFVIMNWNDALAIPRFEAKRIDAIDGYYPVRDPNILSYNPTLSTIIRTSTADNGWNRLRIELFFQDKSPVPGGVFTRLIYIDNTTAACSLALIRIGTPTIPPTEGVYPSFEACGTLTYGSKNDLVEIDFRAWQPNGVGIYTLHVGGGASFSQTGPVTSEPILRTIKERSPGVPLRVGHLVGNCSTASVGMSLSVPGRVIDGFGWVGVGGYASRGFALANPPPVHSPWP